MPAQSAHVYVDGFNLFYGALKGRPELKWLDLRKWSERVMSGYSIERIVYCTARAEGRPDNPGLHERQDRYIRALRSTGVEVIEGKFRSRVDGMFRAPGESCRSCGVPTEACACGDSFVRVVRTEEKGSDVNLAVELVRDVFVSPPSAALVVSGDSDLQRAVDIARRQKVKAVIADPRNRSRLPVLGDERRRVTREAMSKCQLPDAVELASGTFVQRPTRWLGKN